MSLNNKITKTALSLCLRVSLQNNAINSVIFFYYFFFGFLWFSFYYFHHFLPISLPPIPAWPPTNSCLDSGSIWFNKWTVENGFKILVYRWGSCWFLEVPLALNKNQFDWPLALRGTQWLKTTIYSCYLAFCGSNRVHWYQQIFTFQSRLGYEPRSII